MGQKLPYDAEIEYLESTGTQYIEFGNDLMEVTEYKINLTVIPIYIGETYFSNAYGGIMGQDGRPQIGWYKNGWTIGNAGSQVPYIPVVGNKYNIEFSKNLDGSYWVDGVDTGLRRLGTIKKIIFTIEKNISRSKCKLFGLKILNSNDVVVYDFIPVRIGTTGYLYDKVSSQLFGNTGTGEFILGADK